jgi:hypothetical protein
MVRSDAPAVFRSVAYFEGYSFTGRDCLYQDALQIDGSKYTHLHFAFGTITPDYQVQFQDDLTSYEFQNFLEISGPQKILSFGGWDFRRTPARTPFSARVLSRESAEAGYEHCQLRQGPWVGWC